MWSVAFGIYNSRKVRELPRDWTCIWKPYGDKNQFGLPGLLVTCMLIVTSLQAFAKVKLLRGKLSELCVETCLPGPLRKHSLNVMNKQREHVTSLVGLFSVIKGSARDRDLLK